MLMAGFKGKKYKEEKVSEIVKLINDSSVIAVGSLSNLPDRQLQKLRKMLRNDATLIVTRNTLLKRAFKKAGKAPEVLEQLDGPSVVIFTSKMDPFKLYQVIRSSWGKAAAKPGQVAPFDLLVEKGETSLPPGPVLTELKQAGIQAQIKDGKVVINKDSVVAKEGEKISPQAANALSKLEIKPFEVGLNLTSAWESGVVYAREILDVNVEEYLANVQTAFCNAVALSCEVAYPTKQNIETLLGKAVRNSKGLALEANVYTKDVIDLILAKANAQANALKTKAKVE